MRDDDDTIGLTIEIGSAVNYNDDGSIDDSILINDHAAPHFADRITNKHAAAADFTMNTTLMPGESSMDADSITYEAFSLASLEYLRKHGLM